MVSQPEFRKILEREREAFEQELEAERQRCMEAEEEREAMRRDLGRAQQGSEKRTPDSKEEAQPNCLVVALQEEVKALVERLQEVRCLEEQDNMLLFLVFGRGVALFSGC